MLLKGFRSAGVSPAVAGAFRFALDAKTTATVTPAPTRISGALLSLVCHQPER